jgi:hypothetical protein
VQLVTKIASGSKFKKLTKTEPIENEILLDHDYDGIKELDNNLPPWWVYLFYASIVLDWCIL